MIRFREFEFYTDNEEDIEHIVRSVSDEGIDLNDSQYYLNKKYEKFRYEYICLGLLGYVSYDYIIEKFYLTQKRINEIKGDYEIGTKKILDKRKLTNTSLYNQILDDIEKAEKLNNYSKESNWFDDVRQKVEGKSGLITKLKNKLDFRINDFEDQYSKLKLLKFLYDLEKGNCNKSKLNVTNLLSKPSLENVDNNVIKINSTHGKITAYLKNEVMKEVDSNFIIHSKRMIHFILDQWEQQLQSSAWYVANSHYEKEMEELKRINKELKCITEKLPNVSKLKCKYDHTLFETFYLKLLQHENIGRENDIIRINQYVLTKEIVIDKRQINKINTFGVCKIKSSYVKEYVEKNIDSLSLLIYMKDTITEKEKNKIKYFVNEAIKIIEWFEKHSKTRFNGEIPLVVLISCFQEILDAANTGEEFICGYYQAKAQKKKLTSVLKNGDASEEVFQILWINKVKHRILLNFGNKVASELFNEINNKVDKIIRTILEYPNLEDMFLAHDFIYDIVNKIIISRYVIIDKINTFEDKLYSRTGYRVKLQKQRAENLFKEIINSEIDEQIIEILTKEIEEVEWYTNIKSKWKNKMHLERWIDEKNKKDSLAISYNINKVDKFVEIEEFQLDLTSKEIKKLSNIGLKKFI
ncbi:hypothetical protein [Clostridium beijerinckii]|uniref:hypothetical protein n=1 Tax=Clostridium beijerinckii TaxID=1520 RepID=UPI0002DF4754|nr:hypothetical protein [Clostridium beijerinckii]